jgi:hypothetical protein
MAPLDYMGRYMKGFFDYAIADELHQLAGDTAQGNGLAVLGRIGKRLVGLTGTMMGGYADDILQHPVPHGCPTDGAGRLCVGWRGS